MNVAFLLPDAGISGRARTVLAQADALAARGHRVRIVSGEAPATWRSSNAEWVEAPGDDDVVLAEPLEVRIVDDDFYRGRMPKENVPLRLLLPGVAPELGYAAAAHARWFGHELRLIRVAPFAPSRAEPLDSVDEFHVALSTPEMARVVHSCDVMLAPAFGLAAAEAMAAGLAVVLADEGDDGETFGERLIDVLGDDDVRAALRAKGKADAEAWRSERAAPLLEAML